jgi:hypothetical protein
LRAFVLASVLSLAVFATGCSSHDGAVPAPQDGGRTISSGGPGGGGTTTSIPPPPTIDGPAWFIYNTSAVIGTPPSPSVNFDALQNTVQGGISIGTTRGAQILVYNTSKKTPLLISAISVEGPNAADFAVAAASVRLALGTTLPANKGAASLLPVTFTPSGEGARSAVLRLVSNAGTALVALSGTALAPRPILSTGSSLAFLTQSAPATLTVANLGGQALVLQSIAFAGADAGSFGFAVANHGLSNCYAGIPLSPHGLCYLAVGVAPGAPVPSSAVLAIGSNDPVHPETDIQLTLAP